MASRGPGSSSQSPCGLLPRGPGGCCLPECCAVTPGGLCVASSCPPALEPETPVAQPRLSRKEAPQSFSSSARSCRLGSVSEVQASRRRAVCAVIPVGISSLLNNFLPLLSFRISIQFVRNTLLCLVPCLHVSCPALGAPLSSLSWAASWWGGAPMPRAQDGAGRVHRSWCRRSP